MILTALRTFITSYGITLVNSYYKVADSNIYILISVLHISATEECKRTNRPFLSPTIIGKLHSRHHHQAVQVFYKAFQNYCTLLLFESDKVAFVHLIFRIRKRYVL